MAAEPDCLLAGFFFFVERAGFFPVDFLDFLESLEDLEALEEVLAILDASWLRVGLILAVVSGTTVITSPLGVKHGGSGIYFTQPAVEL
ncbi:MAG: hypothetical protein SVT52_02650 [Planctomycetota bacterium]|nr:hypothetical protein [Planctomycetota bacterium]